MCEVIAARATCPGFLLAQYPTCDGLLQGLHPCLHPQLGHLPQPLCGRPGTQHGTGQHQLARWLGEPGQARLDHRAHRGRYQLALALLLRKGQGHLHMTTALVGARCIMGLLLREGRGYVHGRLQPPGAIRAPSWYQ